MYAYTGGSDMAIITALIIAPLIISEYLGLDRWSYSSIYNHLELISPRKAQLGKKASLNPSISLIR